VDEEAYELSRVLPLRTGGQSRLSVQYCACTVSFYPSFQASTRASGLTCSTVHLYCTDVFNTVL